MNNSDKRITTKEEFERMTVDLLRKNVFLATISRYIRKFPSDKVPTAAVGYDKEADDVTLWYNLDFMSGMARDEAEGVFNHELYHVVWQHISRRAKSKELMKMWNIATDLTINSTIIHDNGGKLPDCVLLPGKAPKFATDKKVKGVRFNKEKNELEEYERDLSEEEKALNASFAELLKSLPTGQASDWYFNRLQKWNEENGRPMTSGQLEYVDSMDDHDAWGDVPENMRDLVGGKVRNIIQRAVQKADSQSDGWGNIPSEIREEIRRSVSNSVDWRKVLKSFIGRLNRGERASTFKRINKRYPYQHPGTRRKYLPKVLVAIDQSGSVSNENVERIFGALSSLSKKVSFCVVNFDTDVDASSFVEWRRGQQIPTRRTRSGGTDFESVNRFVKKMGRGRFDGCVICSDGECGKPGDLPFGLKRGWVIVPNHKLLFETNELVVQMEDAKRENNGNY